MEFSYDIIEAVQITLKVEGTEAAYNHSFVTLYKRVYVNGITYKVEAGEERSNEIIVTVKRDANVDRWLGKHGKIIAKKAVAFVRVMPKFGGESVIYGIDSNK